MSKIKINNVKTRCSILEDKKQWQFLPDTHILETKFCMNLHLYLRSQQKHVKMTLKFTKQFPLLLHLNSVWFYSMSIYLASSNGGME